MEEKAMKTLKQYLAAIVSLCMIAAACPFMTYAAAVEEDSAQVLSDGAENEPEMNPEEPAGLTEEMIAENPDEAYAAEAITGTESPSQGADLPETEDVWPEENGRAEENAGEEDIVGAPGVTVGDGVTATFDAAAGSVAFMSDGGTLWKNWITKSGFGADNIKQIWVSYDSGTVYLPEDASGTFEGLKNVTSLDLRGISSTGVINMQNMFRNCNKVERLNISSFSALSMFLFPF
jgi:hypothetical protein